MHAPLVMRRNQFRALAAVAALLAVVLIAMPALGVDPSQSPSAAPSVEPSTATSAEPSAAASTEPSATASTPASARPSASSAPPAPAPVASANASEPDEDGQGGGNGAKPDKAAKKDKAPEHPVTLTGIVGHPSEDDFTLVVGITVYRLSAGPPWWWGDASPLAAVVGKTVTIDGEQAEGSNEVDVLAINGKAIRAPGRPPWAGGWKVVGSKHPGWAQWKIDKLAGKGHGRDTAPGQLNKDDTTP
jgi:hypothetical protein